MNSIQIYSLKNMNNFAYFPFFLPIFKEIFFAKYERVKIISLILPNFFLKTHLRTNQIRNVYDYWCKISDIILAPSYFQRIYL